MRRVLSRIACSAARRIAKRSRISLFEITTSAVAPAAGGWRQPGGIEARPLLRAAVPGAQEDRLDGGDRRPFDLDDGVVPVAAAVGQADPVVGDVEAAREGDAAVAHQRLAVIAPQQRPEAGPPEAVAVVRDHVHAVPAHAVEELGRRVAAADEVVEQPHLDAPARGARQRIGELPSDGVVAENVHLERDARPRRFDRVQPGGERLDAVAQQLDRVAGQKLAPILDVARGRGRRGQRQRVCARKFVSNFRTPGGIWRRRRH